MSLEKFRVFSRKIKLAKNVQHTNDDNLIIKIWQLDIEREEYRLPQQTKSDK